MLVSRWFSQSGSLKVIGQLSPNDIGCKTRIKFANGHWSVSIHLLLVRSVSLSLFVGLAFVADKSFVRHRYLLTSVKRRLLY